MSNQAEQHIDLILPVKKPAGWTSFDVVKKIRRITGIRKVGHAGTLDPFATGLLLICLGRATKRIESLMSLEKEYVAEIRLGVETDTLDPTGKVVRTAPVPSLDEATITRVLESFRGQIRQEIPAYSAAKVQGQRLYKLARRGEKVPKRFKTVVIYQIELLGREEDLLRLRVVCSRGTYIRTLARDVASKLGTVGHLASLVRTRIGPYTLDQAFEVEELKELNLEELMAAQ